MRRGQGYSIPYVLLYLVSGSIIRFLLQNNTHFITSFIFSTFFCLCPVLSLFYFFFPQQLNTTCLNSGTINEYEKLSYQMIQCHKMSLIWWACAISRLAFGFDIYYNALHNIAISKNLICIFFLWSNSSIILLICLWDFMFIKFQIFIFRCIDLFTFQLVAFKWFSSVFKLYCSNCGGSRVVMDFSMKSLMGFFLPGLKLPTHRLLQILCMWLKIMVIPWLMMKMK